MEDDRGLLALEFLRLAARARPQWVVWENVPGVLSSDDGRAFGSILGGLAELGYGWAYRVLDAQFFGVAQRRNRVFVVGCLGNQSAAAAVLFERASLRGDPSPRREAREDVAGPIGAGAKGRGWSDDFERSGAFIPEVAGTFTSEGYDASEDGTGRGPQRVGVPFIANAEGSEELTLTASCGAKGVNNQTPLVAFDCSPVAPTLTSDGKAAGSATSQAAENGALVAFDLVQITSATNRSNPAPGDPAPTMSKSSRMHVASFNHNQGSDPSSSMPLEKEITETLPTHHRAHAVFIEPAPIAFHTTQDPISSEVSPAIGAHDPSTGVVTPRGLVRRLTPREYERLFGFPDDYTLITPATKDGPRYRALGNSMAVPVMTWIGKRIHAVDQFLRRIA